MNEKDIAFLSVAEQAALIEQKEITPTEVVEAYLSRIEEVSLHVFRCRCEASLGIAPVPCQRPRPK